MELTETDRRILALLEGGLPLEKRPWAALGRRVGLTESEILDRVGTLVKEGTIKRLGLIVRHRELGYRDNAMVVWDVPDESVVDVAQEVATAPFVSLCYRRPRRLPDWPYNLFCMVHGRDRATVLAQIDELRQSAGLADLDHAVLFSRRRFKQRGARYFGEAA
jgi:DNA-binding Lrp family transcriptional regulator